MPLFSSVRERRLWLWTAAVMVAIYTTLAPAPRVAAFLRERGLLQIAMALVLLALALLAGWWPQRRPGRGEIAIAIAVSAAYLWTWVRIQVPEERTHLIEYGLVAVLVYQALGERRRHGRRVPAPALLALAATALLGWLDEGIQALLPNRVYDIRDVGFNAFAALLAIAASLALGWLRRRRRG